MQTFANIIDGRAATSESTFESKNPANGETLGLVPHSTRDQVQAAVAAAHAAQPGWAARTDADRRALLVSVADKLRDNAEHLATWITWEQGKPLGGVGPDQVPGARFEAWACEAWTRVPASLDLSPEVVFEDETRRDELHRKPLGVIGAISPWNWPLMIAIWQIVPALRAGNTVVIKPSELTSIGTLEMVRLMNEVLPPGVLNTVTGGGEVGNWLVDNPGVNKVMFTGSAATGAKIAATAARHLTPTTLELGGNDPGIILPGADIKALVMRMFWGAFINQGQTCACLKRLYVHESQHDELVNELVRLIAVMPMGDGTQPGVAMGPIQNRMQFDKVSRLVESARRAGATIVCGGEPLAGPGLFYPLTLVTDISDGTPLVDEEQFGPVLPIIRYSDVEEAIAAANRGDAGLAASVWSSDIEQAKAVALRIEAGTVWINHHGPIHPMVPFGGAKRSGWGVEFGIEGLKALTRPHVVSVMK